MKLQTTAVCLLLMVFLGSTFVSCQNEATVPEYASYDDYPVYNGTDLGLTFSLSQSTFKVWAPAAEALQMHLYEKGIGGDPLQTIALDRGEQGVWETTVQGNIEGRYYAFQAKYNGTWNAEVTDPYVKAVGVNGLRGQVVDMNRTNPKAWDDDTRPALNNFNEVIIYELHVRDMTIHASSGSGYPGEYYGLLESGTKSPEGEATGLDHLKELGITHVHLIPVFDHRSIDETKLDVPQYNWGYDPLNYNVPEGSFSSDPYDGQMRISEFKQMMKTFHDNGIRVILDVVYNHTGQTQESIFNQLVPGYYYRQRGDGTFSDASACGNETASERAMFRKYMVESMRYWAEEYHMDGFRVDLMGIHDIETMNAVAEDLHSIDPTIFIYGEGWKAGDSPVADDQLALKANTPQLKGVAAFSDDIRDGIKGHVFTHDATGFISGNKDLKESVKFGIVAATQHPQVDYGNINYSDAAWAPKPDQCMTYMSCHDNHTLWDRLNISRPGASDTERILMHKLAGTMVLTSQGVSFLHAGVDMLRTKDGVENSFNSPDAINQIDWNRKTEYKDVFEYYRDLIALRKAHPAFRMTSTEDIQENLQFMDTESELLIAYTLNGAAVGDEWKRIFVAFNGADEAQGIEVPAGNWTKIIDAGKINLDGMGDSSATDMVVGRNSALLLVEK
ncbi:MAG: type I pullulanase [Bacteroidota bacterium]